MRWLRRQVSHYTSLTHLRSSSTSCFLTLLVLVNSVLHGRLGNSQNFPIIILCWFVIMLYSTRHFLKTTGETKGDGLGSSDNISHGKDRYDVKKLRPISLSHILEHSGFSSIGYCDVCQIWPPVRPVWRGEELRNGVEYDGEKLYKWSHLCVSDVTDQGVLMNITSDCSQV